MKAWKKKHFDQTKTLLLFSKILISFSSHNQPHHFFTTICDHDFANDLQSPLDLSLVGFSLKNALKKTSNDMYSLLYFLPKNVRVTQKTV